MARRVWRTLLEKEITFEPVIMSLDGDQLQPEFLEINPFHHIPVILDNGFRVIESLAIMDYLEAKYPTPALLPKEAESLAKVRMVQMVTTNELLPKMISLIFEEKNSPKFLGNAISFKVSIHTQAGNANPKRKLSVQVKLKG